MVKAKIFLLKCLFLSSFSVLHAQDQLNTSGGDATSTGGSVSYSIGAPVKNYQESSDGSVTPGVQQAFHIEEISTNVSIAEALNCSVYPNPTTDFVILKVPELKERGLSYQLYDLKGQMITSGKITKEDTRILVKHGDGTVYLLKVINNKEEVKVFKIIKK